MLAAALNRISFVGRKRERNSGQVVHTHPPGNGYRRHLDDVHRSLADDVNIPEVSRSAISLQNPNLSRR